MFQDIKTMLYARETIGGMIGKEFNVAGQNREVKSDVDALLVLFDVDLGVPRSKKHNLAEVKLACDQLRPQLGLGIKNF